MPNELLVLLAEDDDGHAELIQRNLRRGGVESEIIHLHDGEEVLECFRRRNGKGGELVVLLDIRMPRVDGIEVLRALKRDRQTATVPVVMLTTSDDPREMELCYGLGCSFYIAKSVSYQAFSESIQRLGALLRFVQLPWKSIHLPRPA